MCESAIQKTAGYLWYAKNRNVIVFDLCDYMERKKIIFLELTLQQLIIN